MYGLHLKLVQPFLLDFGCHTGECGFTVPASLMEKGKFYGLLFYCQREG